MQNGSGKILLSCSSTASYLNYTSTQTTALAACTANPSVLFLNRTPLLQSAWLFPWITPQSNCPICGASGPTASSSYGLETTKHSGGCEFNSNTGSELGTSNNHSYASWGHPAFTLQATGVREECSHMHSTESPTSLSSPEHQVLVNGSGRITDQKSQNSSLLQSESMWLENSREKRARTLATQQTFTAHQCTPRSNTH